MLAWGVLAAAYSIGASSARARVSQNSAFWTLWETEAAWVSQKAMSSASAQVWAPTSGDQRMAGRAEAAKGSSSQVRPRCWRAWRVARRMSGLTEVAMTGPRQRWMVGMTILRVLYDRVGPKTSRLW